MLFCEKCGTNVTENDLFCSNCMARLDRPGAVITKHQYSQKGTEQAEFSADSIIADHDLTGCEIMEHRLVEKIGSFAGVDYYRAVRDDGTGLSGMVIRHFIFPDDMTADIAMRARTMDKERSKQSQEKFIKAIQSSFMSYEAACTIAGVEKLNYKMQVFYSPLYDKYHIFVLMRAAISLPLYVQRHSLMLRDVIKIGVAVSEILIKLQKNGRPFGAFTDDMIFISDDGKVYLDYNIYGCYEDFYPFSTAYQHYNQFVSPMGKNYETYSLGMLLYYLMSGYHNPYLNPFLEEITGRDMLQAEGSRMAMLEPHIPDSVRNMSGTAVVRVITKQERDISLEELWRVLSNSGNYISAQQLDEKIIG